jgi:hypothetical protein
MKGDTVDSYIARVFPCRKLSSPPESCDSYGVCDNCCDAALIRAGSEIQSRQTDDLIRDARDVISHITLEFPYRVSQDRVYGMTILSPKLAREWLEKYGEK